MLLRFILQRTLRLKIGKSFFIFGTKKEGLFPESKYFVGVQSNFFSRFFIDFVGYLFRKSQEIDVLSTYSEKYHKNAL